jgi:hypothetical protein
MQRKRADRDGADFHAGIKEINQFRAVEQLDDHPVVRLKAKLGQTVRQPGCIFVHLIIRDFLAFMNYGRLVSVFFRPLGKVFGQGFIFPNPFIPVFANELLRPRDASIQHTESPFLNFVV